LSGSPADIAFRELTPVSHLERAAAVFGDRTAVVDDGFTCTYAELWDWVTKFAGVLAEHGAQAGDRVCVLAPTPTSCSPRTTPCHSRAPSWSP